MQKFLCRNIQCNGMNMKEDKPLKSFFFYILYFKVDYFFYFIFGSLFSLHKTIFYRGSMLIFLFRSADKWKIYAHGFLNFHPFPLCKRSVRNQEYEKAYERNTKTLFCLNDYANFLKKSRRLYF